MAKGHRSKIKRERNASKDTRPSATVILRKSVCQKACFVLDAIRGKGRYRQHLVSYLQS